MTAPLAIANRTRHTTREAWLVAATGELRVLFAAIGEEIPTIRVSVGFPGGRGPKTGVIGQCWSGAAAADGTAQIFVSPVLDDAPRVLDVLAHEIAHAVNFSRGESGHGAPFARVAKRLGLTGKMTATVAGDELASELRAIANRLGDYPHAALSATDGVRSVPKQGTRMLKVECASSGYTLRTTAKWLDAYGAPICPCHGEVMDRV